MSWDYLFRALVFIAASGLSGRRRCVILLDRGLVEIFEIRARLTLVYPQVWCAEGTRNKPGVSHEAHPADRSWASKNVGLPVKRALKPAHDVTYGSNRDRGEAKRRRR